MQHYIKHLLQAFLPHTNMYGFVLDKYLVKNNSFICNLFPRRCNGWG